MPFVLPSHGPVLLLSLCESIPRAAMALAALGLQSCLVTIGAGSRLHNVPAELFSDVLHFPHMSTFRLGQLPVIWQAAPFWLILLVGSEACLQKSTHVARVTKRMLFTRSYDLSCPSLSLEAAPCQKVILRWMTISALTH